MSEPSVEELKLLHSNICKAVGDLTRLQILYALREEPQHVNALAERLDTPQPTISRHLAILRQRAIVIPERDGSLVVYSLADPAIIDILDSMRQLLRRTVERQAGVVH